MRIASLDLRQDTCGLAHRLDSYSGSAAGPPIAGGPSDSPARILGPESRSCRIRASCLGFISTPRGRGITPEYRAGGRPAFVTLELSAAAAALHLRIVYFAVDCEESPWSQRLALSRATSAGPGRPHSTGHRPTGRNPGRSAHRGRGH